MAQVFVNTPCRVFFENESSPYPLMSASPNISLKDFRTSIERSTPKFRLGALRYLDDEGDKITIETDIELAEALKLGRIADQGLQIFVESIGEQPVVPPTKEEEVEVPTKEEQEEPRVPDAVPTHRAICDSCNKSIVGIRYKCVNCPDYDLCEVCEDLNPSHNIHPADHLFLKIRRPICPYRRVALPNFYQPLPHAHPHHQRQCPRRAACTIAVHHKAAPAQQNKPDNNDGERITALEAKYEKLEQVLHQLTAKDQAENAKKQQREAKKKAQDQKKKETRELLQKRAEERNVLKQEQKIKKQQLREAARLAKQQHRVVIQIDQPAKVEVTEVEEEEAEEIVLVEVKGDEVQKEEEPKEEEIVFVEVKRDEEPKEEEPVEEEPKEEEEKPADVQEEKEDFVVINDNPAPEGHDERLSFFKEPLAVLGAMGFDNVEKNLDLLAHYAGDIQAVISALLEIAEIV